MKKREREREEEEEEEKNRGRTGGMNGFRFGLEAEALVPIGLALCLGNKGIILRNYASRAVSEAIGAVMFWCQPIIH